MSIKESLHGARIAVRDFLNGDARTRERSPFQPYPPAPRYYPIPEMSANSWQLKIDLLVSELPTEESVLQLIDKLIQFFEPLGIDYTQKGQDFNNFHDIILGWIQSENFFNSPQKNSYYLGRYKSVTARPELYDMWRQFWSFRELLQELVGEYYVVFQQLEPMRDAVWNAALNDRVSLETIDQYLDEKCPWFSSRSNELFRLSRHLQEYIITGLNEIGLVNYPDYLRQLRG